MSLDEAAIHKLHQSTDSTENYPHRQDVPGLVSPPFEPPERIRTPEGIPSWRGQLFSIRVPPAPDTGSVFRRLRTRSSRRLRLVFGAGTRPPAQQTRPWRPPMSGHATPRFAGLESHPFATAPIADSSAQPATSCTRSSSIGRARREDESSLVEGRDKRTRVLSPSQRALRIASGHAVPVSPQRARDRAEASNGQRSVSLPKARPQIAAHQHEQTVAPAAPSGTMTTIDLIEQFPVPPTREGDRSQLLALFPQTNGASSNILHAASGQKSSTTATGRQTCLVGLGHDHAGTSGREEAHKHQRSTYNNEHGEGGDHSDMALVRSESRSRYRHSGTPVYDHEASSLRSLDQRNVAEPLHTNVRFPVRPTSALTGNSRYFSATSVALGTTAMSNVTVRDVEQQRRAVANGALRFTNGNERVELNTRNSAAHTPVHNENNFPITPVTITQASGEYCCHRLNELQRQRYDLDGTSPAPTSLPTAAPNTIAGQEQPRITNQPSLVSFHPATEAESFRHRHHISRHPIRGTWRTRMKRTKCWRCELEARRTASREALRQSYQIWTAQMARLKERLRWTCLCRYEGYDDSSDENSFRTTDAHVRTRLGRLGGRQ